MALPIWQEVKDVRREGITLNNIGVTLSNAGDVPRSLDYFTLAIERRRAAKDQAGEADTLSSMGSPSPGWGSTARHSRSSSRR